MSAASSRAPSAPMSSRAAGLATVFVQANHSSNARRGTLRGMHFQRAPHREVKVVRCVKGAIHDVIIDLRRGSPTYGRWEGFDLTEENGHMLYVPEGFAHGFVTLAGDTHVAYQVSHAYTPGAEGGVRWDDPAFGIAWLVAPAVDLTQRLRLARRGPGEGRRDLGGRTGELRRSVAPQMNQSQAGTDKGLQ